MITARLDWTASGKISEQKARAIGNAVVERIRHRTQSGIDRNDRPFHGYSPQTHKTGPVNLTESGDMLAALHVVSADGHGVVIGCDDPKAEFHMHGTEHMPARQFLGFTDADHNFVTLEVLRAQAIDYIHALNGTKEAGA